MFPNIYRLKKIRKNEKFEKFEKYEKFRGNKLSRTKNFEKFCGINFRGKGQKTRNRESFWPRKFLTLKYSGVGPKNKKLLEKFHDFLNTPSFIGWL